MNAIVGVAARTAVWGTTMGALNPSMDGETSESMVLTARSGADKGRVSVKRAVRARGRAAGGLTTRRSRAGEGNKAGRRTHRTTKGCCWIQISQEFIYHARCGKLAVGKVGKSTLCPAQHTHSAH